MTVEIAKPLTAEMREQLGLAHRRVPEYYDSVESAVGVPYASAIRTALEEIRVSAVFCVQGSPTVAIHVSDRYDREDVFRMHAALWNQGIASLLLVIAEGVIWAYSLAKRPVEGDSEEFEFRCLIETLDLVSDAARIRKMIRGAESGRLWNEYAERFSANDRIDRVLLDNLKVSSRKLRAMGLSQDAAQALLIQTMFIAYLEDRGIVSPSFFKSASSDLIDNFSKLLETGNVELLYELFRSLHEQFEGDLFVAPCSFESQAPEPELLSEHLYILARFRSGREDMTVGQGMLFAAYDFRFIPVELVSAVYDRFICEHETNRRAQGAFYTPMFVADFAVSQTWEQLSERQKSRGHFLDPACGSGIFLVRAFQRLCERWREEHDRRDIPWKALCSLIERVHGWDVDGRAVRVALFSLYIALLEQGAAPNKPARIGKGRSLPLLWNNTLMCKNFFSDLKSENKYEVLIGNPPWISRSGTERSSTLWCRRNDKPMPNGEESWAFGWKALDHIREDGLVCMLFPGMGFLHNQTRVSIDARKAFFLHCRIRRIVNFADFRFQLFENAVRPAALFLYGRKESGDFPYRFDYWVPKANPNLRNRRVIALMSADKLSLGVASVLRNPFVFWQRMWMREPEARLFSVLDRMPKLGDFIGSFRHAGLEERDSSRAWMIGHGYQPYDVDETASPEKSKTKAIASKYVGSIPDLPVHALSPIAQTIEGMPRARNPHVEFRGFEKGFTGTRILIQRGVGTAQRRLRAAYCDQEATFQAAIQGISVPEGEEKRAKLLTAILNSRVAVWHAFHGSAPFGIERPIINQADLLRLPFPSPTDASDEAESERAGDELVGIVDDAIERARTHRHNTKEEDSNILREIDRFTYAYFGLSKLQIAMIEDTTEYVIPEVQPRLGHPLRLWRAPDKTHRTQFAETMVNGLNDWFRHPDGISARLMACGPDLAILRLRIGDDRVYEENDHDDPSDALGRLSEQLEMPIGDGFHEVQDLRIFSGNSLYLIKPMQLRFWLRSAAQAEVAEIAAEFHLSAAPTRSELVDDSRIGSFG